jgi:transposase InsO family protein
MGNTWPMPWMNKNTVTLRMEFVTLARADGANFAELCRRYGISRKSGYKWVARACAGSELSQAMEDRSRRPRQMPRRTSEALEEQVSVLRAAHPAWGPRKLRRRMADLGLAGLPAVSTVGMILRRRGLLDPPQSLAHRAYVRFERRVPNELWQMDFKGHFALGRGGRCHPLTLLDDHRRFSLGLRACACQRGALVQAQLAPIFERYGLPEALLCDNAPPWSGSGGEWTALAVWLVRLGIRVLHGRPYHPQTQGKEERFHRTLHAEVLARTDLRDLLHSQEVFDAWRPIYNHQRPHEALGLATPASRYTPSVRRWPAQLPLIEYAPGDEVRTAKAKGEITWRNRTYFLGQGLAGQPIALRATASDGLFEVFFCHQRLGWIDQRDPPAKTKHHYLPLHRSNPRLQS